MTTVGSFGIDFGLNTARFETGLLAIRSSVGKFERGFKTAMSGLATAATVAVGAFAAIGTAVNAAVGRADDIGDMAAAAGVGSDSFQAWAQAASLAGVSMESFASGLSRANRLIGDAARGIGPGVKALENLGIAARDASGNVKSTEAVIGELSDKIAALKTPAEQASAATAILGRDLGPKMAAFLAQGSKGINDYTDQVRAMGGIISSDVIAKADEAEKQLKALSTVVTAQLTSGLVALTPVISAVGQAFADAAPHIANWFSQFNPDSIRRLRSEIIETSEHTARLMAMLRNPAGGAANPELIEGLKVSTQRLRELTAKLREAAAAGQPRSTPAATGVDTQPDEVPTAAVSAASRAVEAAAKDTGKKSGQKAAIAYAREFSLQIDTSMKEIAELDKLAVMRDAATAATAEWAERSEEAATRIAGSVDTIIFAGFADGIKGVKESFKQLLVELGLELARSQIKSAILSLFGSSGGSGTLLGSIVGLFGGTSAGTKTGSGGGAKFAQGGSFTVPGPSSGDKVIPIFRANGGETVTVTPKGGGGGITINQTINAQGSSAGDEMRLREAARAGAAEAVATIINMKNRGRF